MNTEETQNEQEVIIPLGKDDEKIDLILTDENSLEKSEMIPLDTPVKDGLVILPFWKLDLYKQYFDVSTDTVLLRIRKALWPFEKHSLLEAEPSPDFYGPVWGLLTLVFFLTIIGKFSLGNMQTTGMRIFLRSFSTLFMYVGFLSVLLYGLLHYLGAPLNFLSILYIYGYSMIPFNLLCLGYLLPYPYFGIALVIASSYIHLYFLNQNFGPNVDLFLLKQAHAIRVAAGLALLILLYSINFWILS